MKIGGKYNTAIVYSETIDENAIEQIKNLCNMKIFEDSKIVIMPDVHAGIGCTIGTTMTFTDAIVPNLVGVDIGCGMKVCKLGNKQIDLAKLDDVIHKYIPSGFNIRNNISHFAEGIKFDTLHCNINEDRALHSIGTLGGGNHFIELDIDSSGNYYLVIHSGSRNLGKQICDFHQNLAYRRSIENVEKHEQIIIRELKEAHIPNKIESALSDFRKSIDMPVRDTSYLTDCDMRNYLEDMRIAQEYATRNRNAIASEIVNRMHFSVVEEFTTIHNYIDIYNKILRKGAVSAQAGEKLIIPLNMRDGSVIAIGKGNPEWNYSAPHGAGRIMSRTQAFKTLSTDEFVESMSGIYSTTVGENTLDEAPFVYKPSDEIIDAIKDTATIVDVIKPVYSFKDTTKKNRR